MSRTGQKPIDIPSGVTVSVAGSAVTGKGPKGQVTVTLPKGISATVEANKILVKRSDDTWERKSLHGLSRTLLANMVQGASKGYEREMEIQGVGFKASIQGNKLSMALGFSGPVLYEVPEGATVTVEAGTKLTVRGADKQLVGDVASRIRSFYPAEPYKGKGIRYKGEYVRRKVGKSVA